jgi:hypothetical protein
MSSEDQVSDSAHKLVFVMHSGDAQEVSTSDVVLDCSTVEGLDVTMEGHKKYVPVMLCWTVALRQL